MGELFALSAAALWSLSSFLFRAAGRQLSPVILNATKGGLAIVILGTWILVSGKSAWSDLSQQHLSWLLISGIVGIGIGDTAFFIALNRLGEQRTVLIAETLAPPITISFAFLWMSERLTANGYIGILLTLLGVILGITRHSDAATKPSPRAGPAHDPNKTCGNATMQLLSGMLVAVMCAITAAACQAFGAVISRWVLAGNPLSPIESSLIRMLGGQAILFCCLAPKLRTARIVADKRPTTTSPNTSSSPPVRPKSRLTVRGLSLIATATFLGTVLGIVLQQASLKHTSAGISQTLIATSVLWVLPIAWLTGHRPTPRGILAATLGLAGVAVLCLT
ncbi:MAG TPA: hypothetical protein DDW52_01545 [Planctomycetaceae bacterium]|nr:hypothetical protein [Planctomycetaceae bacterium]